MKDELPPLLGVPPPLPPPLPHSAPPPLIPRSVPPAPQTKRRRGWLLGILGFFVAAFLVFLAFRIVQTVTYFREHPRQQAPGEAEFREANRRIISGDGGAAQGNTPAAESLAKDYAKSLKSLREGFFTKGHDSPISLTKGEFITFCQLNDNSCVFLVHVPELRHFTREAKESLAELAWINAQSVLQARAHQPPRTVVVGVKGALLYDQIMIGDYIASPADDEDGIKTRGSGLSDLPLLYPYFAPAAETTTPSVRQ